MTQAKYLIDKTNVMSVETLIDAFDARDTDYEMSIRTALSLHEQAFTMRVDYASRLQASPLDDPFTFDMPTQELILFSDKPDALIDGILEMALFLRGFSTQLGVLDEWKTQFTIGTWRYIRRGIKSRLNLGSYTGWRVGLEADAVQRFDVASFEQMVFLAGRPEVEVSFPSGANALVISAYQRLSRIMEAVAFEIDLGDQDRFNRRLNRALALVDESILPGEASVFDDLLGPDGFNDRFFADGPEA